MPRAPKVLGKKRPLRCAWFNSVLIGFHEVVYTKKITWCLSMKSHHHCVYKLKYHLALVTKYRRPCFTSKILDRLAGICQEQCEHWEIEWEEFGGEADPVHLMLDMYPNIMPSRLINSLKTVTSRLVRKEFSTHLAKFYWNKPVLSTRAYCWVSAGGAPLSALKEYIKKLRTTSVGRRYAPFAIHLPPNTKAPQCFAKFCNGAMDGEFREEC